MVWTVYSIGKEKIEYRQKLLGPLDNESPQMWQEKDRLLQFLLSNHDVTEGEQGKRSFADYW